MTEPAPEPAGPPAPPPETPPETPLPVAAPRRGRAGPLLALALVIIIVLVGASPYWAPAVMPLLPWGPPTDTDADAALAKRLDQIQAAQISLTQAVATAASATASALSALDKRLGTLERRPPPAAPTPPDLSPLQQQLAQLVAATGVLGTRVAALEKAAQAQAKTDPTGAALAVVALQIGEAVQIARPFPAEYDTFVSLARGQPDLIAAAAPLAGPAKAGVASRAVLTRELRALADRIANPEPPPPDGGTDRIWARLRSLVTIRRVDGAGGTPGVAAIAKAEAALAGGDLAAAIAAVQPLAGADADAARPWLQMATTRLQVETALHQIATLLAAHLGAPAAAAAPPG